MLPEMAASLDYAHTHTNAFGHSGNICQVPNNNTKVNTENSPNGKLAAWRTHKQQARQND